MSLLLGIGVSTSIYLQTLLSIVGGVVRQAFAGEKELDQLVDDLTRSALLILATGIALVVSGVVQATVYGLSVYHALILLALSWLTVFAAITPYTIMVRQMEGLESHRILEWGPLERTRTRTRATRTTGRRCLILLHSLHLSFTAAFGLWLFTRVSSFDRQSPDTTWTSTTRYSFLGYHWFVKDPLFRRINLALYGITLIPLINLGLINLALSVMLGHKTRS